MRRRRLVPVLALLLAGAQLHGGGAAAAQPAEALPAWEQTLYKTLTYQTASNISDLALYALLLGGTATASAAFVAANAGSAMALYYGHDYAWEMLGPPPEEKSHRTIAEKTLTYRLLATAKNFALGYTFGGSAIAATGFVAAGVVTDTAIFVTNEYAWDVFRPRTASEQAAVVEAGGATVTDRR